MRAVGGLEGQGQIVALDKRYQWFFSVKDVHGRDRTFAIGIDNGRVIFDTTPGWGRFEDPEDPENAEKAAEVAEQAGYSLVTASYVARGLLPPPESTQ